jgi:hypothetical protein
MASGSHQRDQDQDRRARRVGALLAILGATLMIFSIVLSSGLF